MGEQNLVGKEVKRLREAKNMTQSMLAARCGSVGWDISENTITKIETDVRCVKDYELVLLAKALRVKLKELLPKHGKLF